LNVKTLIFPSLDAQASMAPSSWAAQAIEFTIDVHKLSALDYERENNGV
jgi:hypothetical protein